MPIILLTAAMLLFARQATTATAIVEAQKLIFEGSAEQSSCSAWHRGLRMSTKVKYRTVRPAFLRL